MSRVQIISPRNATGELKAAYTELRHYTPRIGNVVQIFSLRPSLVRLVTLFFTDTLGAGVLPRQDKEIICVVTSYAGRCKY
jgi:hypothetical protein